MCDVIAMTKSVQRKIPGPHYAMMTHTDSQDENNTCVLGKLAKVIVCTGVRWVESSFWRLEKGRHSISVLCSTSCPEETKAKSAESEGSMFIA